jgi:hypothetical protein
MHTRERNELPEAFCWTRFGTEAGEPADAILVRKERERAGNEGVFFWGIGNSVAPAIAELLLRDRLPEVLFSPIRGRPRPADVAPENVVAWTAAESLDGRRFKLPAGVHVTSREARAHYALVCGDDAPLAFSNHGALDFGALRNLVSGRGVGASQVTAVVSRAPRARRTGPSYRVALRARLVEPYFVRLRDPVPRRIDGMLPEDARRAA